MPVSQFQQMRRRDTAYFLKGHVKSSKVSMALTVKNQNAIHSAGHGFINIPAVKIKKTAKNTQRPPGKHGPKSLVLSFRIILAVPGILGNNAITGQPFFVNSANDIGNTRVVGSGEKDGEFGTVTPAEGLRGIVRTEPKLLYYFKDVFALFGADMG
jgi:hypothetical protein